MNGALQKGLEFERSFFSWSLLGKTQQIADQFARAPGLLSDFLRIRQLLASEIAAGGHEFRTAQDGQERVLEFAGGERDQFSERGELGLLDGATLQPLEIIEALARTIEQVHEPLVQRVLFEKNKQGQNSHTTHGHGKTKLAKIGWVRTQEQCHISHDRER